MQAMNKVGTVLEILAFVMYLCMSPLKHYSHAYEFVFLPLFSLSFLKQIPLKSEPVMGPIKFAVFVLGWIICLVMVLTEYSRYAEDEGETLMRISTNLRVVKLFKSLMFGMVAGLGIIESKEIVFVFMIVVGLLECYCFLTTFTFQNPFHEFLLMVMTFTAIISWVDLILFYEGLTNYGFVGEILFALVAFFRPEMFQKALELKYQQYGQRNVQTRRIGELLAVFVVMKEVILNERQSLKYTVDFENKVYTLLQKMVAKNKINSEPIDEGDWLRQKDFLNEDQLNLLKVLQNRLKQSSEFIAYEFFLITIVRKGFNFKNKALGIYYQRISDKGESGNLFSKIEMKMLYRHLMNQLQATGGGQIHHAVLTFSDSLNQLKTQIIKLCKHQISVVNLFQNSSSVPIERYSGELIQRYDLKAKIKQKIDQLNTNQWHIHSGTFLYICLLYKIIFERQQIIVSEKISKNFVIPSAIDSRKSKFLISQYRNISIFVFSNKLKGMIINQNQYFSKMYGKTVRSAQKTKKYISDLFLSVRQKATHQELMQASTKYEGLQIEDHSTYECWIKRKILLKSDKLHDDDKILPIVERVKISARIYYEEQQSEAFICTIQQKDSGVETRVLGKDLQFLRKYDIHFDVIKQETLQQLNQSLQIYTIVIRQHEDMLMGEQQSEQKTEANVSQNLMFSFDFESMQSKKIQKIQKQYDKQEIRFDRRRITVFLLVLLPVVSLVTNVVIIDSVTGQIASLRQVMEYERRIFQDTLMSEKYIGLNLILQQLTDNAVYQKGMCEQYGVSDMKLYAVQNMFRMAYTNYDQIQLTQLQGVDGDQELQQLFDSKLYKFIELRDEKIYMDYVKYCSLSKSNVFEFARYASGGESWVFAQGLGLVVERSELNYKGLYLQLRRRFKEVYMKLENNVQVSLVVLYLVQSFIFCLVVFVFYTLIGFKYQHILLLRDFKKRYVQSRVRQMDFILSQMIKLQKNEIYDVQVNKIMMLKMTKQNVQKQLTLQQFQKQSLNKITYKNMEASEKSISMTSSNQQLEDEKEYLIEGNETLKERNQSAPIVIMFSFHKYKVLGLLVFFVISVALNVVHNGVLKERAVKYFKMEDLFTQMGTLLTSISDLVIGEVIAYSKVDHYLAEQENERRIFRAIGELKGNRFQEKLYDLFPKSVKDDILYASYCRRAVDRAACEDLKGGVLKNGLSSLVALLPKDYNAVWNQSSTSDLIRRRQVCEKLVFFVNFTNVQFQANLINGYKNIETNYRTLQDQLKIAEGVVTIFLILGIGVVGEIIVGRGRKVRAEVLSMDTKINLYRYQESYRSLLNTMFYREQKDVIF